MAFGIHRVGPSEWRRLREIRLRALSDAPYAFGSTAEAESAWEDDRWAASVERLAWFIATDGSQPVGVIAGLQAQGDDPSCRAVISMWVDPRYRGTRMAQALFASLADWAVQDGANPSRGRYQRAGSSLLRPTRLCTNGRPEAAT